MARMHHMGITVSDSVVATEFFQELGPMEVTGPLVKRGPAVDASTGQPGAEIWLTFLRFDGGSTVIELAEYRGIDAEPLRPENNRPGAAHPAIVVDDIDATLRLLSTAGYNPMSEVQVATSGPMEGMRYVYVIGPDELRVELLQEPQFFPA